MVNTDAHWEPPIRTPMLITVHKLADLLEVPLWKAYEISWVLDRRFYSPEEKHFRVTMRSVEQYLELVEADMPARQIMWEQKVYGRSLTQDWGLTPRSASHWHRLQARRNTL